MSIWTFSEIVNKAKEWTQIALGGQVLTAEKEAQIRAETDAAMIKAGATKSERDQAQAEITSVIQTNSQEKDTLGKLAKNVSEGLGQIGAGVGDVAGNAVAGLFKGLGPWLAVLLLVAAGAYVLRGKV